MRKSLALILGLILMFSMTSIVVADSDIKVSVNDQYVEFDQSSVVIEGRTLVPIRAVCEKLGADVYWFEPEQAIIIVKNEIKIGLIIDNFEMDKMIVEDFQSFLEAVVGLGDIEGETIILDVAPQIINGRTLLPIRAVCETLGATVSWNEGDKTVEIQCSEEIMNDVNKDMTFFDNFIEMSNDPEAYFEAHSLEMEDDPDEIIKSIENIDTEESINMTTMKIYGFSTLEEFEDAKKFMSAKIILSDIPYFPIEDFDEDKKEMYLSFVHNDTVDIEKVMSDLISTPKFYLSDADGNIILEKSELGEANYDLDSKFGYYIKIPLPKEASKKFKDSMEIISKKTDGKDYISVFIDELEILSFGAMEIVDDDSDDDDLIIAGEYSYEVVTFFTYLINAEGLPKGAKVEISTEENWSKG